MATYEVSEITKRRLIFAAGELFSIFGVEGVTVRDIANRAKVKVPLISYHFGGRDGLIDAVSDLAVERLDCSRITKYMDENRAKLNVPSERKAFIVGMVRLLFNTMRAPDRPIWVTPFVLRCALTEGRLRERMLREAFRPFTNAFFEVYKTITGSNDFIETRCWIIRLTHPVILQGMFPNGLKNLYDKSVDQELLFLTLFRKTLRDALVGLGINDAATDDFSDITLDEP
ncbi:MAG: TetR family transcriptional regulator [Victivallaceae bacterium]|nr:TetR family transcriptional regulator [Victivallaceae bacterium]